MGLTTSRPPKIKGRAVTAKAVVFSRKNKVLLLQKPNGVWDLPGGKLKSGERWIEGLAREVFEETGLRIPGPEWVTGWKNGVKPGTPLFKGVFFCQLDSKPKKLPIIISDEHIGGGFFGLKKIRAMTLPGEYFNAIGLAAEKVGA